jgi:PAS domain S-box-containing protein
MTSDKQQRVLVVAPVGRDARLLCDSLGKNGIVCEPFADVCQLCDQLRGGAGAILLTEEALGPGALQCLSTALETQPQWSDMPVILLTSDCERINTAARRTFPENGLPGNLVILEKPIRPLSLRSAVDAALMTRSRQYELRDYLDQRTLAEAVLRESEERYRLLVDGVKDYAILVLDVEGHVTSWNKGAERIKGYRAQEILGVHFSRFYGADDIAQGIPALHLKTAADEGRCVTEGWRVRKDGTRFFASVVITALIDEAGHRRGFSKVTRDITERRRAEEKLRESEEHLAEAQRISHTGSWTWNVSSGELSWSQEHFRLFGLDPALVKPTEENTQRLIHPEDLPYVHQVLDRAVRQGSDFESDYRIVRSDGSIRYLRRIGYPVFNKSGDLTFVGTVMDVTDRKQAEMAALRYQQELQMLTARLIEAQETESKYLARELHDDFSQNLSVLGIDIAALAHAPPQSSEALAGRLLNFTEVISTLAKDIHRISRQLHPAILDDLGLAAALRNECIAFSEKYGVPAEFVSTHVPPDLTDAVSLCLYRVAQESLRNVGKHARATGVRVNLTGSPDELFLTIEDLGDGFDLETIKGRRGLGLVSMEERVRLVKGKLSIQSQPGKGTCVEVRVPL